MGLTEEQVARFEEEGYVIARQLVPAAGIEALRRQLDDWIEDSRAHDRNYGETPDGKARFDLEPGHSAAQPKLRRVANPADVSEAFQRVLWQGALPEGVADLIGPDVKFHHCKLNIKLPGMETRVDYHQDHPFDPHTNHDMVTTLTLLDDMSEENGCLRVVPGSQHERYSHYRGDDFVGKIADELAEDLDRRAVPIEGKAGDVCLMHTWTVHGGAPNLSNRPRRLLICDYTAADAFWLTPPIVPSLHSGRIVHGKPTRKARLVAGELELPPHYEADSFFGVQGQGEIGAEHKGRLTKGRVA
jgi:ectoine hydroxylase-related dioxygenase (phytanoyl-CoA dioxygenase family)